LLDPRAARIPPAVKGKIQETRVEKRGHFRDLNPGLQQVNVESRAQRVEDALMVREISFQSLRGQRDREPGDLKGG